MKFFVSLPLFVLGLVSASADAADSLTSGAMLGPDQALVSANNAYMLTFQSDSNLVLYDLQFKRSIWSSNTAGKGADRVVMQADGNLVMYKDTSAVWNTNTNGKTGAVLGLGSDGNLVLVQNGATIWSSKTKADGILPSGATLTASSASKQCLPGSCIASGGYGTYYAVFQSDGNFVVYNDSWGAEWATNTGKSGANKLVMQTDGNLVLFQDTTIKWQSNTAGNPGAFLVMQKDKNLILYNTSGSPIWSNTWNNQRHCSTFNIVCRAQKTFSNIADWVKDAADDAKAAADITNSAMNAVQAQANKLAAASASISKTELSTMAATAKSAYASSISAIKTGYDASVNALKSAWTAAIEAMFRDAGQKFIDAGQANLSGLLAKMSTLDDEGKAAVNRIKRAIPGKQINAQVATDMKLLASKLGMVANQVGSNIPSNILNSSWSILLVGVDVGAGLAGATSTLSMSMNVLPDSNGNFNFAIVSRTDVSYGIDVETGVDVLGVSWSPGTIDQNEGYAVAFGVAAAYGKGANMVLTWTAPKSLSLDVLQQSVKNPPGVSLSLAAGIGVDTTFKASYTTALVKKTL